MTNEERCERTELLKEQCAHCKGLGEVADPYEGLLIDRWMQSAKYAGSCKVDWRHKWQPGDRIALAVHDTENGRQPFDTLGWVCEPCSQKIAYGRGE